jgi:hypothetical protein
MNDISNIVQVVDEFLPTTYQDEIQEIVFNMPWFWRPTIAQFPEGTYFDSNKPFEDPRVIDAFAFAHACYSDGKPQSAYFEPLKPILRFLEFKLGIKIKEIIRVRLRLTPQFPGHSENMFNPPHVDLMSTDPFKTFVYYVHDSDGDTVIFNRKYDNINKPTVLTKNEPDLQEIFRNTPKKGTGVYFDGLYYHSGNSPIHYKSRCIINFDFTIQE